jgi:trans-aconitate methyltransferase
MALSLNNWSKAEVDRAESTWGKKVPPYSKALFDFAIEDCASWLDMGCGFGRFLNYLTNSHELPNYIGYDGSADMISRISENFPVYSSRVFHRDITKPINNHQESIVCSAVLIHLPKEDQTKILKNVKDSSPLRFAFDINSPEEDTLPKRSYFETRIKCSEGLFRMTWQSHYEMTRQVLSIFDNYHLTQKFYTINNTRKKVLYLLERIKG